MKRFLFNVLTILLILVIITTGIELLISYRLKQKHQYYSQGDWHMFNNHNSDILFVGNSRTRVQVDPVFLTNELKTGCEIIGQNGQGLDFLWYKLKEYIKVNKTPEELYVQVDLSTLNFQTNLVGIECLRPYFFMDRIDLSEMYKKNGYHSYYRYIPLAAMDFKGAYMMIMDKTIQNYSFAKNRGCELENSDWRGDWSDNHYVFEFDPVNSPVPYVDSFFKYCKTNNVKLNFYFPPMSAPAYRNFKHPEKIDSIIANKATQYDYPAVYRNYNDAKLYNDSTLFFDHIHLNIRGVRVFMHQLLADSAIFLSVRPKKDSATTYSQQNE